MTQPCPRDCPDRSPTCHATCRDWATWEAYKKPIYAARALAVDEYSNFEIGQAVKRRGQRAPRAR